jgi:hypothetical protein
MRREVQYCPGVHLKGLNKHIYVNSLNITFKPNKLIEYLAILLFMPEISGPNLDPETDYSGTFRSYTPFLHAGAMTVPQIILQITEHLCVEAG